MFLHLLHEKHQAIAAASHILLPRTYVWSHVLALYVD